MSTPYEKAGRNDPCPCGSGRKFKKCHGEVAKPVSEAAPETNAAGFDPSSFDPSQLDPNSVDPQWMLQFASALQRLPKGQLIRLQSLMQKSMQGKDVSQEAEALEKQLPAHLKSLLQGFKPNAGGEGTAASGEALTTAPAPESTEAKSKVAKIWNKLFK